MAADSRPTPLTPGAMVFDGNGGHSSSISVLGHSAWAGRCDASSRFDTHLSLSGGHLSSPCLSLPFRHFITLFESSLTRCSSEVGGQRQFYLYPSPFFSPSRSAIPTFFLFFDRSDLLCHPLSPSPFGLSHSFFKKICTQRDTSTSSDFFHESKQAVSAMHLRCVDGTMRYCTYMPDSRATTGDRPGHVLAAQNDARQQLLGPAGVSSRSPNLRGYGQAGGRAPAGLGPDYGSQLCVKLVAPDGHLCLVERISEVVGIGLVDPLEHDIRSRVGRRRDEDKLDAWIDGALVMDRGENGRCTLSPVAVCRQLILKVSASMA
jgi:hypothetical protein